MQLPDAILLVIRSRAEVSGAGGRGSMCSWNLHARRSWRSRRALGDEESDCLASRRVTIAFHVLCGVVRKLEACLAICGFASRRVCERRWFV